MTTFQDLCQQSFLDAHVFRARVGSWLARQPQEQTPEVIDKIKQAWLEGLEGEKAKLMMRVLLQHVDITDAVVQKLWNTKRLEFGLDYISLEPQQRQWVEKQVQNELSDIHAEHDSPHKASAQIERLRYILARLVEQGHTLSPQLQNQLIEKATGTDLERADKRRILQILTEDPTTPNAVLQQVVPLMDEAIVGVGRQLLTHPQAETDTLIDTLKVFANHNGYTRGVRNALLHGRGGNIDREVLQYMVDTARREAALKALLKTITTNNLGDRKLCYYTLHRLTERSPLEGMRWLEEHPKILQQAPSDLLAILMKEGSESVRKKVTRMLKDRNLQPLSPTHQESAGQQQSR